MTDRDTPVVERVTTLFDMIGSVLIALGVGMGQFAWVGWWFGAVLGLVLLTAGGVFLLEARVIEWVARPEGAPQWWPKRSGGDRK